jgi:hypothetical protein
MCKSVVRIKVLRPSIGNLGMQCSAYMERDEQAIVSIPHIPATSPRSRARFGRALSYCRKRSKNQGSGIQSPSQQRRVSRGQSRGVCNLQDFISGRCGAIKIENRSFAGKGEGVRGWRFISYDYTRTVIIGRRLSRGVVGGRACTMYELVCYQI